MDEIALISAAQDGDLEAFNQLVLTYQEIAFNVAFRILSDEDASADATQNAFLSAYKNIKTYRGGSFKAWILRIVTNTCYDELRRIKRHPTTSLTPLSDENDEEVESPNWLADDSPSPEEFAERADLDRAVQHCLAELPDEFRSVVVLIDIQGLDYQEVSNVTGSPLGTIKSRLARARLRMRECLRGFWELLPVEFRLDSEE